MQNLRISTIQSILHWEAPAANKKMFESKIANLAGSTDLILLPEMFTTGFTNAAAQLAERMDGPTIAWMTVQAQTAQAVICGSFIVEEDGNYFNRLIWMPPDGHYEIYDKRHLFTLANEHHYYKAGENRLIIEYKGWRICPLICYDLRFPVWSRNTEEYDLLIYIANFPERRTYAWQSLLKARAIENQAFTVGVNRVGTDGNDIYYSGDTMVLNYEGRPVYQVSHIEDCFTTSLSYEALQNFRAKLLFLNDRDQFEINRS